MKTTFTTIIDPLCFAPASKSSGRLEKIASRQRDARMRDLLFGCFIALAAMIGATTVGAAVHEAAPDRTVQR